jgi:hypothetical protein
VPTVTLKLLYRFFVIEQGLRGILHFNRDRSRSAAPACLSAYPRVVMTFCDKGWPDTLAKSS